RRRGPRSTPDPAAAALEPPPASLPTGARLEPSQPLALDQPSHRDAEHRVALSGEGPEPRLRHDRVLVLAADVLEVLRPVHEPARTLRRPGCELGGVARALGADAGAVKLLVGGIVAQRRHGLAQALELARGHRLHG